MSSSILHSTRASDPLETTVSTPAAYVREARYSSPDYDDFAPSTPREAVFRHSGWAGERRRILQAMRRTGVSGRRLLAFADCGNTLWLALDGSSPVLLCNRCHDRLCKPCAKERSAAVIEGVLLKMLDSPDTLRFLTLTLKHCDAPLGAQIDRLLSSFKLLRRRPEIAADMVGGAWFLEVKLDKAGNRWHPHLHVVVAGNRVDHKLLSRLWLECTGDSYIVDIRAIREPAKRARYVAKYATKPLHAEVSRRPEKLEEFLVQIKGRRLYQCFGTWARAVDRTPSPKRKLELIAQVDALHSAACAGCVESLVWLHQLHAKWPRLKTSHPAPFASAAGP